MHVLLLNTFKRARWSIPFLDHIYLVSLISQTLCKDTGESKGLYINKSKLIFQVYKILIVLFFRRRFDKKYIFHIFILYISLSGSI